MIKQSFSKILFKLITYSDDFNELHKKALSDRNFGKKLAIALTNEKVALKDSTLEGIKLRTLILQTIQNDYERVYF